MGDVLLCYGLPRHKERRKEKGKNLKERKKETKKQTNKKECRNEKERYTLNDSSAINIVIQECFMKPIVKGFNL